MGDNFLAEELQDGMSARISMPLAGNPPGRGINLRVCIITEKIKSWLRPGKQDCDQVPPWRLGEGLVKFELDNFYVRCCNQMWHCVQKCLSGM